MDAPEPARRHRGLQAIHGALGMLAVLLVVQMWVLTATLEAFLAGHRDVAVPGAIVSGVLFAASAALYLFIGRVDAATRDGERGGSSSR